MNNQPGKLQLNIDEIEKQLAEKQRELEIKSAMERVRARALNMHNSFELSDVLSVLYEHYDILGIAPVFSHHTLFDLKNNIFSFRLTRRKGLRVQARQVVAIDHSELTTTETYLDSFELDIQKKFANNLMAFKDIK